MSERRKRFFIRAIIVIFILAGLSYTAYRFFAVKPSAAVGDRAPDIQLTNINGERVNLKDWRGKRVMINFWASWCGPCKKEMPAINDVYEKIKHRDDVAILEVNVEESRETVKDYLKKMAPNFPVLLDSKGKAKDTYGVSGLPTTFFVDPKGKIVEKVLGPMDVETIKHKLLATRQ